MNLKRIRLLAEKTQQETAKAINITQNTYSNYENGKTAPDIDTLIKLADYFHTTIDNICGHEVPYLLDKSQLTTTQMAIIEKIKTLQEEACQKVEAYIIGLQTAEEEKQRVIQMFINERNKRI